MADLPLSGVLVVDLSRMLPGAVLARTLIDLGARLIKVEAPVSGDPLRHVPPLTAGTGAGFAAFFRGAESIEADLGCASDASRIRRLIRHADIVTESFRPGTLAAWGLGAARLMKTNPTLIVCSLTGYGQHTEASDQPAHDLNLAAVSGLLDLLATQSIPRLQLVDVTAGLTAATSVLAALLHRARTGHGSHLDLALAAAALVPMVWPWADLAAGAPGAWDNVLAGRCPGYRRYRCSDGREIAVAAIEPKFWTAFVTALGRPDLAGDGLDTGPRGRDAATQVAAAVAERPSAHWTQLAAREHLPVTPVNTVQDARTSHLFRASGWLEVTPAEGPGLEAVPGPLHPGRTPLRRAPTLGEHTLRIADEFGLRDRS